MGTPGEACPEREPAGTPDGAGGHGAADSDDDVPALSSSTLAALEARTSVTTHTQDFPCPCGAPHVLSGACRRSGRSSSVGTAPARLAS